MSLAVPLVSLPYTRKWSHSRLHSMSDVVDWFTTEVPDWESRSIDLDVKAVNSTAVIAGLIALDLPPVVTSKINVGFYVEAQVRQAYNALHELGSFLTSSYSRFQIFPQCPSLLSMQISNFKGTSLGFGHLIRHYWAMNCLLIH